MGDEWTVINITLQLNPAAMVESSVVDPCSDSELEQQKPSLIAGGTAEWQSHFGRETGSFLQS